MVEILSIDDVPLTFITSTTSTGIVYYGRWLHLLTRIKPGLRRWYLFTYYTLSQILFPARTSRFFPSLLVSWCSFLIWCTGQVYVSGRRTEQIFCPYTEYQCGVYIEKMYEVVLNMYVRRWDDLYSHKRALTTKHRLRRRKLSDL